MFTRLVEIFASDGVAGFEIFGTAHPGHIEQHAPGSHGLLVLDADSDDKVDANLRLGDILRERGREAEAIAHYQAALDVSPDLLEPQMALGGLLARTGDFSGGARHFDLSVGLDPQNAEAHFGRALALILAEEYVLGLEKLEESVAVLPANISLKHLLARLLATCPDENLRDGERAVMLAERAADQTRGQNFRVLDTLGTAYAAVGRFPDAMRVSQRARQQALSTGDRALAHAIEGRLVAYAAGEAFVESRVETP